METAREFTYHGDRVSAGGGCEAAATARMRCWWATHRQCSEFVHGRRFPLRQKGAVYKSNIWSAILYGSQAQCQKKYEIGILQRTERSKVRAICGVQLKDKKSMG